MSSSSFPRRLPRYTWAFSMASGFGLCRRGNGFGRGRDGEWRDCVTRILGNEFAAEGFGEDGGVEFTW